MARSLSFDLRSRVSGGAIVDGLSCRQAAGQFGINVSSAIRWQALCRAGGDGRPKSQGGDHLSRRTDAHAGLIAAALAETPDMTMLELREPLATQRALTSVAALWRYYRRHGITRKKRRLMRLNRTGRTS